MATHLHLKKLFLTDPVLYQASSLTKSELRWLRTIHDLDHWVTATELHRLGMGSVNHSCTRLNQLYLGGWLDRRPKHRRAMEVPAVRERYEYQVVKELSPFLK